MSRIKELKEKYPHLNLSFFDIMTRIDISKSNKYLPLICKIFSKRFKLSNQDFSTFESLRNRLLSSGISVENLNPEQCYVMVHLLDYLDNDSLHTLTQFMGYMERGLIENNDVMKYNDLDSVKGANTLASLKELTKDLEGEIVREYEDEKWVILRPLTFAASAKYGANTRWCTTYNKEKNYFEKYWRRGILVYFINKLSGYKFAGYKSLDETNELSFWNQEDSRVDYLVLEVDDYLFPIVRKIFQSKDTNKNLCSSEIQEQVHAECLHIYEEKACEPNPIQVNGTNVIPITQLWVEESNTTVVPTYEPPTVA